MNEDIDRYLVTWLDKLRPRPHTY